MDTTAVENYNDNLKDVATNIQLTVADLTRSKMRINYAAAVLDLYSEGADAERIQATELVVTRLAESAKNMARIADMAEVVVTNIVYRTDPDVVLVRLYNGQPRMLAIRFPTINPPPNGYDDPRIPPPPEGFLLGEGFVDGEWEYITLLHLCGEPTFVE